MEQETDYLRYRGKCKEMSEQLCLENPSLTLVRGHYYCPFWNVEDAHWWTVDKEGIIHDPSRKQYPSSGQGIYTPFDGTVECSNCGKTMNEDEASFDSNYAFCSTVCHMRFVGL